MVNYQVSLTTKIHAGKLSMASGRSILVIEPEDYSKKEVEAIKAKGYTVLGYLSIGSVSDERPYYGRLKPYRLKKLEDWPHEWYLDLRKAAAGKWCVERAGEIRKMGFDGLWLDNLDLYEEYRSPAMYAAITSVLQSIRPIGGYVMINGGAAYISACISDSTAGAALYRVQLGDYSLKEAKKKLAELKASGFAAILKKDGAMYRLQAGAYARWENAKGMRERLHAAGYTDAAVIKTGAGIRELFDGVTQEEVFSLIKDYDAGKFAKQSASQSGCYQRHLKRCREQGIETFLLEYTKSTSLAQKIKEFSTLCGMTGFYISQTVDM